MKKLFAAAVFLFSAGLCYYFFVYSERAAAPFDLFTAGSSPESAAAAIPPEKEEAASVETDSFEKAAKQKEKDSSGDEPEGLVIYICGAVKQPGVYHLPVLSRICDAVAAAGGLREDAVPELLNLAEKLQDGQKIYIPDLTEAEEGSVFQPELLSPKTDTREEGRVDLNRATREELTELPGIGEKRAEAIIAYREERGGFLAPDELMEIEGIGESLFNKLKDLITTGGK